jgi:hypothetical protein
LWSAIVPLPAPFLRTAPLSLGDSASQPPPDGAEDGTSAFPVGFVDPHLSYEMRRAERSGAVRWLELSAMTLEINVKAEAPTDGVANGFAASRICFVDVEQCLDDPRRISRDTATTARIAGHLKAAIGEVWMEYEACAAHEHGVGLLVLELV